MYLNLTEGKEEQSIHLAGYPSLSEEQKAQIDVPLEEKMHLAQQVVTIARALRNETRIKVRQPLAELIFVSEKEQERKYVQEMAQIISDELNVKKVVLGTDSAEVVTFAAKPNFRVLGSKAGKLMGRIASAVKNFNAAQIQSFLQNGYEHILIDGHEFRLEAEDIEITSHAKEGFSAQSDRSFTVALNTQLDDALLEEGFAREFVNRIQNFRKEAGFEVTDHIRIQVQDMEEKETDALKRQKTYICNETLADEIQFCEIDSVFKKETNIEKQTFLIGLSKI